MKTEQEIKGKLQELYDEFEGIEDVSSLRGMYTMGQLDILNWVLDND